MKHYSEKDCTHVAIITTWKWSLTKTKKSELALLFRIGDAVEKVTGFRFLGLHITEELCWTNNTSVIEGKTQQHLYYLKILMRTPVNFYRSAIESILTYCMTVWYAKRNQADRKSLQPIASTAQDIIRTHLLDLDSIYTSWCLQRTQSIIKDPSHPS